MEAVQYAKRFAADAGARSLHDETFTLFRYIVRKYALPFWDRLGRDWTFDDYPFQVFTFAVMPQYDAERAAANAGGPPLPLIGIGPALLKRIAAGSIKAVVTDLSRIVLELPPTADDRSATEAKIGLSLVNGDTWWTASDLVDLRSAFGKLSPRERAIVAPYTFWRFTTLAAWEKRLGLSGHGQASPSGITDPNGHRVGIFDFGSGRPRSRRTNGQTVTSTQEFQHGVPTGVYTALHEVGHTVHFAPNFSQKIMTSFEKVLATAKQPITDGSQSRGSAVHELYAEAFARFHVDPAGLGERSATLLEFFGLGKHLPPR